MRCLIKSALTFKGPDALFASFEWQGISKRCQMAASGKHASEDPAQAMAANPTDSLFC